LRASARWWRSRPDQPLRAAARVPSHRAAPELVLVGALAWCFFVAEVAVYLELSREMGAMIAGVALSTFPYALDVTPRSPACATSSLRCSSLASA